MLFLLSRIVPVRMSTRYRTTDGRRWHTTWVQWAGRIWRHRTHPA